ncbi:MAG TPA: SpoIVB peptidase S55 domain-containing protein [Pyrinomonadaceae bacterium]|nr:SpoIVB peptidase S55 domain-containing protein [Pyrinomonadaceae bacterium]
MKNIFLTFFTLIIALSINTFGQTPAKFDQKDSTVKNPALNILPLSEVKEGMKGIARTVFRGNVPEEFNVEILGVVPGAVGPKQDMIVGKISGGGADRTFVFAGMSGSPVYINGKLVGYIFYSFSFSKEPICGIMQNEQMIEIFEKKPESAQKAKSPRSFSFAELASTDWQASYPRGSKFSSTILAGVPNASLNSVVGQSFQPIATPISFNGFSQETLNFFAPQLSNVGLMPVAAIGGAAKIAPMKKFDDKTLLGGTSVSMELTRGDYSMSAAGTVTFRDGEKIYAFGHPFLGLGVSSLAMSESHVVTVIPNINNSFKLAVSDAMVGTMTQDRNTGVFGNLGQSPKMIPVKLTVQTSRNNQEVYNYEVAKDNFLTPLLMNITVYNSLTATERALGETMVEVNGEVKIKGQEPIKIERRFAGMQASQMASGSIAAPINVLLRGGFDNTDITEINLNMTSVDDSKTAVLERISLNKGEVKAGETFEASAFIRTNTGQVFVQRIPVTVPADTPAGTLLISVGDGGSLQRISQTNQFVPKTLGELIKTINEVKKNDRLYVQAYRITNGAIIGAKELPNLPPSVLATLNNDRTAGGFTPTVITALVEKEIPPAEFLITGQQVLPIEVIK